MGWIKERIDAEYRKHKTLDWSRIAEVKINSEFKEKVEKLKEYVEEIYIGDISDEERENLQKEINKIFNFEPEETRGEEK